LKVIEDFIILRDSTQDPSGLQNPLSGTWGSGDDTNTYLNGFTVAEVWLGFEFDPFAVDDAADGE
jgi:hypothetical protein